jgi:hypothetical protein
MARSAEPEGRTVTSSSLLGLDSEPCLRPAHLLIGVRVVRLEPFQLLEMCRLQMVRSESMRGPPPVGVGSLPVQPELHRERRALTVVPTGPQRLPNVQIRNN